MDRHNRVYASPGNFRGNADPNTPTRELSTNRYMETPINRAGYDSATAALQDLTPPGVQPAKSQATLREQEQELVNVKKENFNLKLRLYHINEQMLSVIPTDAAEAVQQSIELKVQLESLQKEIADKNALVLRATQNMDNIGQNYEGKLQSATAEIERLRRDAQENAIRENDMNMETVQANETKDAMARRIHELEAQVTDLDRGIRASLGAENERDRAVDRMRMQESESAQLRGALQEKELALKDLARDKALIKSQQETIMDWQTRYNALESRLTTTSVDPNLIKIKDDTIKDLRKRLELFIAGGPKDGSAAATSSSVSSSRDNATIADLRLQISRLKSQADNPTDTTKDITITKQQDVITELELDIKSSKAKVAALEQQGRAQQQQLAEMQAMLSQQADGWGQASSLKSEAVEKDRRIEMLQIETERLRGAAGSATSQAAELRTQVTTLEAALHQHQHQHQHQHHQQHHHQQHSADDTHPLTAQEKRLNRLEESLNALHGGSKPGGFNIDEYAAHQQHQQQTRDADRALSNATSVALASKDRIILELTNKLNEMKANQPSAPSQQHEQVVSFLETELSSKTQQISSLQAKLDEEAKRTEGAVTDLPIRLAEAEARARTAEQLARDLKGELASTSQSSSHVQSELARLRLELREKAAQLHGAESRNWSELEDAKYWNEDTIDRLRQQLSESEEERNKIAGKLRAEETRAEELMMRLRNNDAIIRRVQQTADEATIANTQVLKDIQASRDAAQFKLDELLIDRHKLETALATQQRELDERERRQAEQTDSIASLREDLAIHASRSAMVKTLEEDLQSARAAEKRLADNVEGLQDDLERIQKQAGRLAVENSEAQNQVVSLEGELRVFRTVSHETEENDSILIRDLQGKVERLRNALAEEEENVRRLKNGFVEKETAIKRCERALESTKSVNAQQQDHIVHLVEQLQVAEAEVGKKAVQISELEAIAEAGAHEIGMLKQAMDDLAKDIGMKEMALGELQHSHEQLVEKAERDFEELCKLQQITQTQEVQLLAAEQEVTKLESENKDIGDAHAREKDLIEKERSLNDLLDHRETTIRDLTATLTDATTQLANAQLRMTLTPQELDTLHRELAIERRSVHEMQLEVKRLEIALTDKDDALMKSVEEKIRITDELTTRCAEYGQTLANQEVELKTFARIAEDKLAVEAEAKNLAHACEDLSVQLERLRTDLGESEHEKRTTLKALKDSNEEATILAKEREAVAAELDHQTIARGELISKHNRLEERSSELERALVAAEAARDLLTEQHRTATADTESIKRQFNAADADRTALKERTTSLQAALNEKVASEAAEREKSTQIIRGLHRDRDELDAKLGECESDNEKLAARIRALSHEKERADLQYQSALNEFRLASSANEHQAMQFVQCAEKVDELASRLHQVEESKAAVSAALGHAEATRDHLESDIHQLREDNVLLTSRLEAGANERSMLAAKLDADVTHELRRENRMLRDSLVETTAIAEQLRSQLLNKNASKEESERRSIEDMQSTLQLLRSTKEMLIEEDRRRGHMRSHIRHTEFHSSTHR